MNWLLSQHHSTSSCLLKPPRGTQVQISINSTFFPRGRRKTCGNTKGPLGPSPTPCLTSDIVHLPSERCVWFFKAALPFIFRMSCLLASTMLLLCSKFVQQKLLVNRICEVSQTSTRPTWRTNEAAKDTRLLTSVKKLSISLVISTPEALLCGNRASGQSKSCGVSLTPRRVKNEADREF